MFLTLGIALGVTLGNPWFVYTGGILDAIIFRKALVNAFHGFKLIFSNSKR